MNARTVLLGLFVALTMVFASTTAYESGLRTTLTSTSTATSVSTITATTTQTTTVTAGIDLTTALTDAYLFHIFDIASGDAIALAAQYETSATLLYDCAPYHGSLNDSAYMPKFYEGEFYVGENNPTCFPLKIPSGVANQTYAIMSNDGKAANVTSHLLFYGNDPECPAYAISFQCPSGTAYYYVMGFNISYVLQGDHWLISTESVTISNFERCVPVSLSPDGSILTCPTYQIPS